MALTGSTAPRTTVWVVPVADLGGVARHVLDTLRARIPSWRTVLLCPPGPLAEAARGVGAAVLTAPIGPSFGLAESRRALAHAVSTLRPDVVHSHLSYADIVVALTRLPGRPARVSTEHGIAADDEVYHSGPVEAAVMARAHQARLHRLDALIAVSEATAAAVRQKWTPPRRLLLSVRPNGIDRLPKAPARSPGVRIAALSRLAPEKRVADLLLAFARLLADEPAATLTIAGDGPDRAGLVDLAGRLGLSEHTAFVGHVDAGVLLERTDVLAQLSVWENCSYSLLDAVAAGVGVVATAVGGNPEMLPPQCLVPDVRPATVARALRDQGTLPASRPALPGDWPTVAEMTTGIAEAYAAVCGDRR